MNIRATRLAFLAGAAALAAPLASPAQADTLREALAEAYQTNPTLQSARAQQRANDENVPIQQSSGLPSASFTAQHIEFVRTSGNSFTAPERTLQAGIDLGVPIYSGGSVKNSVRAARERVSAGQADLRATESSIFSLVVAAYMSVIRNEAIVGLTANQIDVLSINLQATADRFEIGDLTRTDIAQSQSRLAVAESDFRSAQANLIGAREVYIQLVGRAPTDLQPPPPLSGLPSSASEAVDIALEFNPDLMAAKERAAASELDIKVAGASRLPTVSLFANTDYTNFYGTLGGPTSNNFAQSETTANAGISLRIPIFQGGRPAALQRQATARATSAFEQVIAAERDVIAQVRASYSSWIAANSIIVSSQTAVAAAELGLEGVRAENSIGNRTILDVLNAEQELLSARVQLVTARRNAYVAGFSLLAAMGRAEARDLGLDDEGLLYDPVVNLNRVDGAFWDWDRDPDPVAVSTRTVDITAPDADIPQSGAADAESNINQ
ncbi:TolC family outer membrane protein [Pontixanthobacter gangjinensis]|uniref:TolC family outer membrane protein n=1 Tax=Pontixanthobacter gangjinensis TaxID=1028742 RepID=UPI003376B070